MSLLHSAFSRALADALGPEHADIDPHLQTSQNPEFGDYQANFAMSLAKQMAQPPRVIAEKVAVSARKLLHDIATHIDVAGPGFINIKLRDNAISTLLGAMDQKTLSIGQVTPQQTVVIDMCSVNVAKQMHVGHLRSTIIGDTLGRVLERLGHIVIRQNHLGDWGLQIGMVLHMLRLHNVDLDKLTLDELERAYRHAQLSCKSDAAGLTAAQATAGPHRIIELEEQNQSAAELLRDVKQTLVALQQGDAQLVHDWRKLIDVTMRSVYETIALLNVNLDAASERGESFYRDRLTDVITAFSKSGLADEDDGAMVVRFEEQERPLIIRKSDGGFLYATTDLAAIRYRVQELGADRVIYVVGSPQREHFRDVFAAARLIGWDLHNDRRATLEHVAFGSVLGSDNKMLKTRSGENIKLRDLLEEAIERGIAEVTARAADPTSPTHDLTDDQLAATGRSVGIGAVKYADLSNTLVKDYVFDFDRMIVFEGATGPYLQYAHARICSIFAKLEDDAAWNAAERVTLAEPAERSLALLLLRYPDVVQSVAASLEPHRLCGYLYELADAFSSFYQSCPVLKAEDAAVRDSRLRLSAITRRTLEDGLHLLGIDAPQRM